MWKKASIAALLLVVAAGACAQHSQEEADLIALRAEARQLERAMYDVYNRLNSDDNFDVACDEYKVTGSIIPEWQCNAAFMREAALNASASRYDNPGSPLANTMGGFVPTSDETLLRRARRKIQQLNDEMRALARQHQELAASMIAYNEVRQQLENSER